MTIHSLIDNLSNPALLFFLLGIIAVQVKSDLEIPENSSKLIAMYLLLSIGFKGGQELAASGLSTEIIWSLALGIFLASAIPVVSFFVLKRKLGVDNAGAIAASYGSVSAVTCVTTISFLDFEHVFFGGHMVAVMAVMEAPAIIIGVLLISFFKKKRSHQSGDSIGTTLLHSITNGSVLLILGSLVIGFLTSHQQAESLRPFTHDLFKGFLLVFLLDMGISSGKHLKSMFKNGVYPFIFSICMPFVNGILALLISTQITDHIGNQLIFAILGASASYIAVPAVMKQTVPQANPSLYLPMALGITFPINVVIGIPFYYSLSLLLV